jgi:hypothetical protein
VRRAALLFADDRPTSLSGHVLGRHDLDVLLLRFESARQDLPGWYLDRTERLPSFWLAEEVPIEAEAVRYLRWTERLGVRPTYFCNPSEPRQDTAQRFAGLAGLPHLTRRQVTWVRDKVAMKGRLRELGLRTAAYTPVRTTVDVLSFGRAHGWPLVVKPVDSFACIDTFLVPDAAGAAALGLPPNRSWMAEAYVGGEEWENCALILGGEVLDVWPSAMPARPLEIVDGAINANISAGSGGGPAVDLRELTQRIVTGMGLDHGYLHMEFFLDGGEVVVGEVGLRMAGCEIAANHGHAYGFDVFRATLDVHLGRRPDLTYGRRRCVGDLLLPLPGSGRLRHITGEEELPALPGVIVASLRYRPGDLVTARRASHSSAGYVHVAGDSVAEVEARMREVLRHYTIDVQPVRPAPAAL